MTDRRRRGGHDIHELLVVDLAAGKPLARFPDHGSRARALAMVPAVQHRPDRQGHGRNVHRRRRHQACGSGLVAAGGQDHAVQGIAEQDFDQAEIGEVAIQRRGRALAGFLDRMRRKFHRDAAGGADSLADPMRQFKVMAITRRKIVAGLRNADDRLAGLQFVPGQAVVKVALEVERGHPRVVRVVKPFAGTEFAPGDAGKRLVHWFSRSAHALFLCVIFVLAGDVCMSPPASQRCRRRGTPTTLIQRHRRKSLVKTPVK